MVIQVEQRLDSAANEVLVRNLTECIEVRGVIRSRIAGTRAVVMETGAAVYAVMVTSWMSCFLAGGT